MFTTGQGRKTDATDAHSVALVGTRMAGLRPVVDDQQLAVLRVLVDRRRSLGEDHTRMIAQLHHLLLQLIPGGAKKDLSAAQAKTLLASVRPRDAAGKARRRVAAELIADLERVHQRKKAANKELEALLAQTGTSRPRGPGVMRMVGVCHRRTRRTAGPAPAVHTDLVGRRFVADGPDQLWSIRHHRAPPRAATRAQRISAAFRADRACGDDGRPRYPPPPEARAGRADALGLPWALMTRWTLVEPLPLEQAEVAASGYGLGPGGALELLVDRGDMGLHGVAGDVQLLADLPEREVGRQQLEHAHFRRGQRHRARDPDVPSLPGQAGRDPLQLLA